MKNTLLFALFILMVSCSKEVPDLTVKGIVKGLKKGTIYLKKQKDTALVIVDSLVVNGNPNFEFHSDLDSPEVFYLYLDKNSSKDDRIPFFADKGITEINTNLKNFAYDAKINGSEQQKKWEEYKLIMARFAGKNLDLIKENFDAQKSGDTAKINRFEKDYNNNIKRRYLYTVNFALNNKNSEVAPFLALTEIYDAKVNFLDTINNSLTPEVKASKYGKELQLFIDKIKLEE